MGCDSAMVWLTWWWVVVGHRLDLLISKVFSNLSDSVLSVNIPHCALTRCCDNFNLHSQSQAQEPPAATPCLAPLLNLGAGVL